MRSVLFGLEIRPVRSSGIGPRELRRTWFLFVTCGEFIGFMVPAAVSVLTWELGAPTSMATLVLAGAVEGAVLGSSQALVLERELPGSPAATGS